VGEHLAQPAAAVLHELLEARGPCCRHGRQDPAAGLEDLEVVRTALSEHELALTGAAE